MDMLRPLKLTVGAHQRRSVPLLRAPTFTLSNSRSTGESVMDVWYTAAPGPRLMTARWRGNVSVSTYTVPAAAEYQPSYWPPLAERRARQSPPIFTAAKTATRPPPPGHPSQPTPPAPLALTLPVRPTTRPATIHTLPPAPEPPEQPLQAWPPIKPSALTVPDKVRSCAADRKTTPPPGPPIAHSDVPPLPKVVGANALPYSELHDPEAPPEPAWPPPLPPWPFLQGPESLGYPPPLPLTTPSIDIPPSDVIDKTESEPPAGKNVPVLDTTRLATLVMLIAPEYVAAPEKKTLFTLPEPLLNK